MAKHDQQVTQRTKLFTTKALSVDDDAKSIRWVLSTDAQDRYGEIVHQDSWKLDSFKKNPVLLWGHDPYAPENVLGTVSDLRIEDDPDRTDGRRLTGLLTFDTEVNPKADLIYKQAKKGTLRTGSVGFIPHTFEMQDDIDVLKDNELLEFSVVAIPANSGAVALSVKEGSLNVKDARWLIDSMERESELIKKQLSEGTIKEKKMTEDQATQVLESVAALSDSVKSLTDGMTALQTDVATLKEATTKAADEKPEGDPAKGGDNDQPGAGEDEFDENTELTPEQLAELDEAAEAEAQAELEAEAAKE